METKQVIVVRKDLKCHKGKMAAQVAHASLGCITNLFYFSESADLDHGKAYDSWAIDIKEEIDHWLKNSYRKICLSVNSEEELLLLHQQVKAAGLNCRLILDSALTEFKEPTYTCLGIGPHEDSRIDIFTSHLPLY